MSSNIPNEIEQATRQLQADVKITHDVTHGDENTEVVVDSGVVPSLRKRLKDIEQDWAQTADPLAADLADTVQVTKGYKDAAAQSASEAAAELSKVQQEGASQVSSVQSAGSAQVQAVNDAGTAQTGSVNSAGATQVQAVTDKGSEQTEAVTTEGVNQIGLVKAAGIDQVSRVESTGNTQTGRVTGEGNTQNARIIEQGDTQTARAAVQADRAAAESSKAQGHREFVEGFANQFGDIDQAIGEATAQADRSKAEADKSTSANNSAQIALSETNKAKDDARAIVYDGEYSQTSKPGSVAVADSKGHLDIGWTPLLQALYPYSGVIGSVDVDSVFAFHGTDANYSNIIRNRGAYFNINGRYVQATAPGARIQLPDAESTAERAMAFDDIFLDWNGQIQVYRSVSSHRTATGYDRDAIAREHGYLKVQTGLYKTGETYALLLGRVARRNQGAYHPLFNPEGCRAWCERAPNTGTVISGQKWHAGYVNKKGYSTNAAFVVKIQGEDIAENESCAYGLSGAIEPQITGRSDSKPYDAIYADDFTPLYYSAKNVIDRQALLFDSFNRAVAGETFSGAEGTVNLLPLKTMYDCSYGHFADYIATTRIENHFWTGGHYAISDRNYSYFPEIVFAKSDTSLRVYGYGHETGETIDLLASSASSGNMYIENEHQGLLHYNFYLLSSEYTRLKAFIDSGNKTITYYSNISSYYMKSIARPQFMMVDIIGSMDAMPDEWKTNGIPGNWLAVGEEGESLIPVGTTKNFKLSRKCLECYQVLYTGDKGVTWLDQTSGYKPMAEGVSNSLSSGLGANGVLMVFYRTSANPFDFSYNTPMYALSDVISGAHYKTFSVIMSNLMGKVASINNGYAEPFNSATTMTRLGAVNPHVYLLEHYPTQVTQAVKEKTPCMKCAAYLTTDNKMGVIYNEMKYNGTSWGDNDSFNISHHQSTFTDLNGESVIRGIKQVEIPYQLDEVRF